MLDKLTRGFCRIGIDVGGTFTDFVLANQKAGSVARYKEPSVPEDPSMSIERGLPRLLEVAGVGPADVELIVHGTTLALNATIQRRGAKLGLVVSKGNRGILEIARGQMPNAFDFASPREVALVPRDLILETSARLSFDGTMLADTSDAELDGMAERFRTEGITAATVMLMHSFAYPELERKVAKGLAARLPDIAITASADVWPEKREYERTLVALINAFTLPIMVDYFARLEKRVDAMGITAPIYITANNGGILSLATARQRPIDSILSGPASGVVASAASAVSTGTSQLLTVDMGGTSADMSMVHAGRPLNTTRAKVGEFPIVLPVIGINAIGAGGGSIVHIDAHDVLKIGPQSAGASPGPICYGKGGEEVTITDCYVTAGLIDPARFLGGRLALDAKLPLPALEAIGRRLKFTENPAVRAAEAAIRVAAAVMATEMSRELATRGDDARDYTLLAFGGAGPTHANLVAEEAGIRSIIVPTMPATFCALGAILADVKRDYVVSRKAALVDGEVAMRSLDAGFAGLEAEAQSWIEGEGNFLEQIHFEYTLDMRYVGQGFDLQVLLPDGYRQKLDAAALTALFHDRHDETYSYRDLDSDVIVTAQRVRVVGRMPDVILPTLDTATGEARPSGTRNVYHDGAYHSVPVYQRRELLAGHALTGPALVEQDDTTTFVLPGWHCRVDTPGNLLITQGAA